mmetsp:Transcript_39642/g.117961  ORF Transcript_39642/g.117961 Transcript_39642/m.117961 type:complete len:113 (-) Transcript_39642:99-437(-)
MGAPVVMSPPLILCLLRLWCWRQRAGHQRQWWPSLPPLQWWHGDDVFAGSGAGGNVLAASGDGGGVHTASGDGVGMSATGPFCTATEQRRENDAGVRTAALRGGCVSGEPVS